MAVSTAGRQDMPMVNEVVNPNSEQFDFEAWAIAVKRQMMAVIKRRGETETKTFSGGQT